MGLLAGLWQLSAECVLQVLVLGGGEDDNWLMTEKMACFDVESGEWNKVPSWGVFGPCLALAC